jgi:hypothetical protein
MVARRERATKPERGLRLKRGWTAGLARVLRPGNLRNRIKNSISCEGGGGSAPAAGQKGQTLEQVHVLFVL